MNLISEYYSIDKDRSSLIYLDGEDFLVQFRSNATVLREVRFVDKHITYVEDAADNWVQGVMKL